MKKYIIPVILGLIFAFASLPNSLLAQESLNQTQIISGNFCINLTYNLHIGSRDYNTLSQVSTLQTFLISRSYGNFAGRGYFGYQTMQAVKNFQLSNGIIGTGYVGPLTRAKISSITCGGISNNVSISNISPSAGPIGTQVTIYGNGFTQDNRVRFGSGGAVHVSSYNNGTILYFTIPSSVGPCDFVGDTSQVRCQAAIEQVHSGAYQISVENKNGNSNPISFNVTSSQPFNSQQPVINGVSAPTTLNVNQSGNWVVSASDPQNSQLTYSVNWGDQSSYSCPPDRSSACAPIYTDNSSQQNSFQQSASFNHSYPQAGTYVQTFTVRNSTGQQVQTSTSVRVLGSIANNNNVSISALSPTSGPEGTQVTIYGSGFLSNNTINFGTQSFNVSSANGSSITFAAPYQPGTGCTDPRMACPTYQFRGGNFPVSVTNSNGTSNSVNFYETGSATY